MTLTFGSEVAVSAASFSGAATLNMKTTIHRGHHCPKAARRDSFFDCCGSEPEAPHQHDQCGHSSRVDRGQRILEREKNRGLPRWYVADVGLTVSSENAAVSMKPPFIAGIIAQRLDREGRRKRNCASTGLHGGIKIIV